VSEAEALIERGETLFQEASFDAALATANEARRKVGSAREPRARVLRLLGKIHASRGDYDKAIDAYDGALALDPADRIARIGREQAEAARGASAPADEPRAP
jgi:tetratricopeptide (TPR) repeat protein